MLRTTESLLVVMLLAATTALGQGRTAAGDLNKWMTYYYLDPQPDEVEPALRAIKDQGLFENRDAQAPLTGFFAEIFKANPQRIDAWVHPLSGSANSHVVYSALWIADNAQSRAALEHLAERAPLNDAALIRSLLIRKPPDLASTAIDAAAALDYFWGRFMASGDEAPVLRVVDQVKPIKATDPLNSTLISMAAQWSVTANVKQHRRVREIVSARTLTSPSPASEMLVEILRQADIDRQGPKQ
jgi:hypothetical protein